MIELEIGDVVRLRSGGPFMTVFALIPAKEAGFDVEKQAPTEAAPAIASCVWFNTEHEVRNGNYNYPLLVKVRPHRVGMEEPL